VKMWKIDKTFNYLSSQETSSFLLVLTLSEDRENRVKSKLSKVSEDHWWRCFLWL